MLDAENPSKKQTLVVLKKEEFEIVQCNTHGTKDILILLSRKHKHVYCVCNKCHRNLLSIPFSNVVIRSKQMNFLIDLGEQNG